MYENIDLKFVTRILGNGKTVLITTYDEEKSYSNVIPVSQNLVISEKENLFGFMINKDTRSWELIKTEKEFTVNLPTSEMVRLVNGAGLTCGEDMNKFFELGIDAMDSIKIKPPAIPGCAAHIEFEFVEHKEFGENNLVIARAVFARTLENCFKHGFWNYKHPKTRFIYYEGEGRYVFSGEYVKID